ncbi:Rieske (2Fe-2S) protein [Mycolicibacterium komossense]|uniref:Rieske (2Fe-2S) protein n=1 Tax=Mycolicibacterium komossense TaxID=1779 RepID=A0ABT3CIW7_9MYCO|nr:Rieske (2Fe-2S) protein [Mycolicibacterium komossense]MCV7229399.1 Rieske (2Fe-2S) protein [Mycolicibacterium komossense]
MRITTAVAQRWPKGAPLQYLSPIRWDRQRPTYQDAQPGIIDAALRRSQARPSGNWYVLGSSDSVRADRPFGTSVAGVELVAWRDADQRLRVGPGACPHLGAALCTGRMDAGTLICPWHGLRLSGEREFGWRPLPSHDDGVLAWVRLDSVGGEDPTDAPVLPGRPTGHQIAAVTRLSGACEPQDIIANRLDPWHGGWFHPYSFAHLDVLSSPPVDGEPPAEEDRFVVAVTFHLGRLGVPVIAEFTTPEPRTIVMRVVEGEGVGSVVETHATPTGYGPDGKPRTDVLEVVIAHSDRPGFARALRGSGLIKPVMRHAAARLWRDDLVYAERRYHLRTGGAG